MQKRILFLAGSSGRDTWMWKIYEEMNKRETIIPCFIATREKNVEFFISKGIKKDQILDFFSIPKNNVPDLKFLEECEKKYKFNIWDAWYVTSVRRKGRSKIKPKTILGYFDFFFKKTEKMIQEFKPDYYICYGPAGYHSMILHEVLRQNKIPVIELVPFVISNRFTFSEDLTNIWPSLLISYDQVKKQGFSEKEKKNAEQFIINFQNKPKDPYLKAPSGKLISEKVKKMFSYAYQLIKYRNELPDFKFIFWPLIQRVYDQMGLFEKPKKGEKYVFFPLHFQPEATTLIYGKWYVDQTSLIENLSKSIPISHMLYVKVHPSGYGNKSLNFYKRIKKLPNVRLISPHENTFKLIKNCSLLTTITGTAGWEATLFQKPVVTFGNIFYNVFEETVKIQNIEELPEKIRSGLEKKVNYNKLVEFIVALFRCTHEGLAWLPGDCYDLSLEEKNNEILVNQIHHYMKKHTLINKENQMILKEIKT
jgi:hypothetical protein